MLNYYKSKGEFFLIYNDGRLLFEFGGYCFVDSGLSYVGGEVVGEFARRNEFNVTQQI
jgi:hypothetical protein